MTPFFQTVAQALDGDTAFIREKEAHKTLKQNRSCCVHSEREPLKQDIRQQIDLKKQTEFSANK